MPPGCDIEQVYLCREPIDFRKSINGLSVLVEQELELNPFGSALYVFINRQRNKIKVLYWHRNGFCLWLKRLEAEKFASQRRLLHETHISCQGGMSTSILITQVICHDC
ncbi:MAG: IS66 family insertion sequence element accessory protein TnpB [Gallionella sp.]